MTPKTIDHKARALKGQRTAFNKGVAAARAGKPESACPYTETSANPGYLNFGRSWRRHWLDGHRSVKKDPSST